VTTSTRREGCPGVATYHDALPRPVVICSHCGRRNAADVPHARRLAERHNQEYAVGQRVRNVVTGVTGTVVVDTGGVNVEVRHSPSQTQRLPRNELVHA